jgi:3-phenylpropionate/cinnamic acid dioxygenase small subunit
MTTRQDQEHMTLDAAAEAAIRRTLALYCHSVDDGRFDDLALCFAPDAVVEVGGERVRGLEAIKAWLAKAQPPERRGRHVTTNSVIDVDGEERARATSDFLFVSVGPSGPVVTASGRYRDTFRVVDGAWLLASRAIVLDR